MKGVAAAVCLLPCVSALVQLKSKLQAKSDLTSVLAVVLDENNGAFNITLNDVVWFGSKGKGVALRSDGNMYSVDDGSLYLDTVQTVEGRDSWGKFSEVQLTYKTGENDAAKIMMGNIRNYKNQETITFEQVVMVGLDDSSSQNSDGVVTRFPVFDIDSAIHAPDSVCLFTSWDDEFPSPVNSNWVSPTCRKWSSDTQLPGGIAGTGPMVIWDEASAAAVDSKSELNNDDGFFHSFVLSPLSNVMALNLDASESTPPGQAAYGVIGNATYVPAGFSTKTVLFHGQGINGVMSEWGQAMRSWYGKQEAAAGRSSDITLQYLGYSTDNGAYYYYNTVEGENYEETMSSVKQDALSLGLPFRYQLLDSWWYLKGDSGGVAEWDATAEVFPDGMTAVYNQTKLLVQAHNRWWDPETVYAKENGGDWEFEIDQAQGGAVPMQQAFWDHFLAEKAGWGLRVYEQDWLYNEFVQKVSQLQQDPTLGRRWLTQMARGAEKNGLTIQYCMPHMRHLLQSLEFSVVTQARASDDYKPSNQQWAIGGQSVLFDALGLAPSKDSYWSVSDQPGNPYEGTSMSYEPFPEQQAVVTTLSAAPVATSDKNGLANVELIMRACMKDGRLLQPSSPAKLIDRAFRRMAQPDYAGGVDGQVWGAWSEAAGRVFGYVFAANLTEAAQVTPSDLNGLGVVRGSSSNFPRSVSTSGQVLFNQGDDDTEWMAVNVRTALASTTVGVQTTLTAQPFSSSNPLSLQPCGQGDFALWAILPVEPNGQAYFGEVNKWIGTSAARLLSLTSSTSSQKDGEVTVELAGSLGEELLVGFVSQDFAVNVVLCNVTETGRVFASASGCVNA